MATQMKALGAQDSKIVSGSHGWRPDRTLALVFLSMLLASAIEQLLDGKRAFPDKAAGIVSVEWQPIARAVIPAGARILRCARVGRTSWPILTTSFGPCEMVRPPLTARLDPTSLSTHAMLPTKRS